MSKQFITQEEAYENLCRENKTLKTLVDYYVRFEVMSDVMTNLFIDIVKSYEKYLEIRSQKITDLNSNDYENLEILIAEISSGHSELLDTYRRYYEVKDWITKLQRELFMKSIEED